jgi:hypothetical protein
MTMTSDQSTEEREETTSEGDEKSEEEKAKAAEEKHEAAQEKMKELEEDPPEKLEDWPTDEAKYTTFGGPEGDHSYEEGPEKKMGPSEVRHHEDGSVSVAGEKVDDPEEYKGDPIPGGPTDPDAPKLSGERDASEKSDDRSDESSDESEQSGEERDSD